MTRLATIQADILTLIDHNPRLAASTKAKYRRVVEQTLEAGVNLTDAKAIADFAQSLSKSRQAHLKAAIRLWSNQVVLQAKAGATPENVAAVLATTYRLEALNEAIQVEQAKGQKAHTWLTTNEVVRLLATCEDDVKGRRDRIVLGLLVAAGLRREELVNLTFEDILLQPVAGKPRTVLNIQGKGAKDRVVPINDRLATALDEWHVVAGEGYVARSVNKGGRIGKQLSPIGVFKVVAGAGAAIGKLELAPHDLRRTYAQFGYEAGVPITQISMLLGHASVTTTQRYLNLDLDLETTVSDFIPF